MKSVYHVVAVAMVLTFGRLVAEHRAQLWIGHDKDITARIHRAPRFYE